jgi:hypothetical protein
VGGAPARGGDGRITSITNFLGAAHFQRFGLPDHLDVDA